MTLASGSRAMLVRSLALVWLVSGHAIYVPATRVPFGATEVVTTPPILWGANVLLASFGAILCFPLRTARLGAGLLGGTIVAMSLASEVYFANYRLCIAALLLVAAIAPDDPCERALGFQSALVYLGAAIDKLLDPAFVDGTVVRALIASVAERGAPYSPGFPSGGGPALAGRLVDLSSDAYLALALSVILIELGLVVALARRSRVAIGLALVLHGAIAATTGSTFGLFFHAALASAIAVSVAATPRLERATLGYMAYAASPFEHPVALVVGAAMLSFFAIVEATKSRTGPS